MFPKEITINENKNKTYEIKKCKEKIKQENFKYNKKITHIIFGDMKQLDPLVIIFIQAKLI